jgi:hypothetical protein
MECTVKRKTTKVTTKRKTTTRRKIARRRAVKLTSARLRLQIVALEAEVEALKQRVTHLEMAGTPRVTPPGFWAATESQEPAANEAQG